VAHASVGSYSEYLPIVAADPPVYISEYGIHGTPGGGLRFLGEVMNSTSIPVYDVTIRIFIRDQNGQTYEFFGSPIFTATLPGQLNPFDIYAEVDLDPGLEEIKVEIFGWSQVNEKTFATATVLSIVVDDHLKYANVTTTIRNDQMQPLYNVVGLAWSFETWTLFEFQPVADVLLPGETAEFSTLLEGPGPSETNIKAAAQGEVEP
jgi:hypothetical protein